MRLFRRGEDGLDARPSRRRSREPRGRARAATGTTSAGWSSTSSLAGTAARSRGSSAAGSPSVRLGDARLALLKPETYMNESGTLDPGGGRVLQGAARGRRSSCTTTSTSTSARLQARLGGGLAGHNGLRSIAQRVGSQDFLRLRIGVGRPGRGDPRPVADYVLSPFAPEDDAEAIVTRGGRRRRGARRGRPRGDAAAVQLSARARNGSRRGIRRERDTDAGAVVVTRSGTGRRR